VAHVSQEYWAPPLQQRVSAAIYCRSHTKPSLSATNHLQNKYILKKRWLSTLSIDPNRFVTASSPLISGLYHTCTSWSETKDVMSVGFLQE
jgi:hypothetical protein